MPDDEVDKRTLLASFRERDELELEKLAAQNTELLAILRAELEQVEITGKPSDEARTFALENWPQLEASKLQKMKMIAEHLEQSIEFIERAPTRKEGAIVIADQAGQLESMALDLRVFEAAARLVDAVTREG